MKQDMADLIAARGNTLTCLTGQEISTVGVEKKDEELYIFFYSDKNGAEVLKCIGRFASNPELSLNWYDVSCLCKRIRQEKTRQPARRFQFH